MSAGPPRMLVSGDPRHGVTRLAAELREEVLAQAAAGPGRRSRGVHVHFTDRLHGSAPTEAADWFESLAARTPVTVTLHDLPQDSDGTGHGERAAAYRRVVEAASGVVCNSEHERLLLADLWDGAKAEVIPLPVHVGAPPTERPEPAPVAGVLGYFYPGKGHLQVARALTRLPEPRPGLAVLGGPSPGHEAELDTLVDETSAAGVTTSVTGYLDEPDLVERCREVAVPVVAHEHVSASGSLNSWLSAGRRPLVRASRYAHEMAALRPGSCVLYGSEDLPAAIAAALADPGSTWLSPGTDLRPDLPDVAAAYRSWWHEQVFW